MRAHNLYSRKSSTAASSLSSPPRSSDHRVPWKKPGKHSVSTEYGQLMLELLKSRELFLSTMVFLPSVACSDETRGIGTRRT